MSDLREPVAAIDLGTNTALLLVARRAPDHELEVLAQDCKTVRLGERRSAADRGAPDSLAPEAVERTLKALESFKQRALRLGVAPDRLRVTATEVLRRASDAMAFVQRCAEELGLGIDIL